MHGGGGLLGLLALLVDAAVDLVAGGAHGGGVSGERAGGVDESADDGGEAGLHLLHGQGEAAYLVGAVDVEGQAGEVAGGDGVGTLGDEMDGMRDAAGEKEGDEAADDGAEKSGYPECVERGAVRGAEMIHLIIGEVGLRFGEGAGSGDEGFLEGKDLILECVVGLCGSAGGLRFVELLDLVFHRLEIDEGGGHGCAVGAEIVVGGEAGEAGHGGVGVCDGLLAGLAEGAGGGGVDSEEHVGFEVAGGVLDVVAQIAGGHDEGDSLGGDGEREPVGFLNADVCGIGAEQAREDEDAGADCEFEFKLHVGPQMGRELVTGDCEDYLDVHDGGVGGGGETPLTDGLLGGGPEEFVAGFDVGFGDGAAWQDGDVNDDGSVDAHAMVKLRIDRRDSRDDGPVVGIGGG